MSAKETPALPRGPHQLSRHDVEVSQRQRVKEAMVAEVGERGYVATSVAHIIATAGVSRATFYQLYKDKEDCFLDAFDTAGQTIFHALIEALAPGTSAAKTPSRARLEQAIDAYLAALASHPAASRTFLVEVYAAGPAAIRKRQQSIESLAELLAVRLAQQAHSGFPLQLFLHGVSSMVSMLVGAGRFDELPTLKAPLAQTALALLQGGMLEGVKPRRPPSPK